MSRHLHKKLLVDIKMKMNPYPSKRWVLCCFTYWLCHSHLTDLIQSKLFSLVIFPGGLQVMWGSDSSVKEKQISSYSSSMHINTSSVNKHISGYWPSCTSGAIYNQEVEPPPHNKTAYKQINWRPNPQLILHNTDKKWYLFGMWGVKCWQGSNFNI